MNPFLNYPNEEMLSAPFENSFPGNGTVRFKFSIGFSAWFDVAYKIKNKTFVPDTGKTYKVKSEKPLLIGKTNYIVEKVKV